jgi:Rrf2 family protein
LDPKCEKRILARKIADETGISKPYLTKILHRLGRAGLINGKRGYRGGIALTRPANRISVLDISEALDGDTWKERCLLGLPSCGDLHPCPLHEYWLKERRRIERKLARLTLDEVARFKDKGWRLQ